MKTKRKGDWIQTYTGLKFYPLDPKPEEISILDISHSLSNQCRFGGHTKDFYSVANHCTLLADSARDRLYDIDVQKWCLLHDSAEAYVMDIPTPFKKHIIGYMEIEDKILEVIRYKFNLPPMLPKVKDLDYRILADEARCLMLKKPDWIKEIVPLDIQIIPLTNVQSDTYFLEKFNDLFK